MNISMRAKLRITNVEVLGEQQEVLNFVAVSKSDGYPEDGSDENNTYAMWTPTADLKMTISNPALLGKFKVDEEYYVDFIKVK